MGSINGKDDGESCLGCHRPMISSFIWSINYGCIKDTEWSRMGRKSLRETAEGSLRRPFSCTNLHGGFHFALALPHSAFACINHDNVLEGIVGFSSYGSLYSIFGFFSKLYPPFHLLKAEMRQKRDLIVRSNEIFLTNLLLS